LPESVKTDDRNGFWNDTWFDKINRLVRGYRSLGMTGPQAYQKVDDAMAKLPEVKALRLQYRGHFWYHYGWEARTNAFAPNVPAGGFEALEKHLTTARKALEEAWKLEPRARTAAALVEIDKAIGGDRDTMELWFDRAMKADGDDRGVCWSKLDWLDPKWHGSFEEMLAFGRRCRDTKNWWAGITLLVADAHSRYGSRAAKDHREYMASPEVWADIQSVYDEYLKHRPGDDVARSKFATFCYLSNHFREAEVQYVALGDNLTQWSEYPFYPLSELKKIREYNKRIVMGTDGAYSFPGWHFVRATNEEDEWYVNVPAHMPSQEKPGILGADKSFVCHCDAGGISYELRAVELPDAKRNDSPERILEAARAVVAKERGAQPRNVRDTLLAARPAQEYDIDLPGPKPMRLRVKAIVLGNRLYELSVAGSKGDVEGKNAREFFDSFAYQPKAKPTLEASEH
jgi:hypothetical protein